MTAVGASPAAARILLVDDDCDLLAALRRRLTGEFDVTCAPGARAALTAIAGDPPYAVVVSDMRMPDMDGVSLLQRLKRQAPDTVRIVLTGYADLDGAIGAVNEGWTFRFLCKPCAHGDLMRALRDGVAQHRLVTAERQLLEETLAGSVQALVEVLSLAAPAAFERALLLRTKVAAALDRLGVSDRWELEVASMFSQLGMVSLPDHTTEKLRAGHPLDTDEQQMVARLPQVADRLLAGIPRLEHVRDIIAEHLADPMPGRRRRRRRRRTVPPPTRRPGWP